MKEKISKPVETANDGNVPVIKSVCVCKPNFDTYTYVNGIPTCYHCKKPKQTV